ncbi:HesA/MoeB/ThiF family protein, partial [Schumannella luteola]
MSSADSPRYARQRVLTGFGAPGQERLAAARVVVIGAGGLGSAVLPALAAAGVGTIVVVDHDTVDESNLPRQTVHGLRDVGRPKVDSAADRMRALTDHVTVITERERFDATTAARIVAGADVLVDASDSPAARSVADAAAADVGIPLVWGSALGYGGQTGVV